VASMDDPVYQQSTLLELQRGLADVYSSIFAQDHLKALDKIQIWEEEWTEILRDPDNPDDNGIPPAFYRCATALLCECYLEIDCLLEHTASIAVEPCEIFHQSLTSLITTNPIVRLYNISVLSLFKAVVHCQRFQACLILPMWLHQQLPTDNPSSTAPTSTAIHDSEYSGIELASSPPVVTPGSMEGQAMRVLRLSIDTTSASA
jgi:hypothetical protein